MFASVPFLVCPFRHSVSPVAGSNTEKVRSVFASVLAFPCKRLIYFFPSRLIVKTLSPIENWTSPVACSLFWLIKSTFLRTDFELELKIAYRILSIIEDFPE